MDFEKRLEQARIQGERERANKRATDSTAALFIVLWAFMMYFII